MKGELKMIKNGILSFLCLLAMGSSVLAQETAEPFLFPELANIKEKQDVSAVSEENITSDEVVDVVETEPTPNEENDIETEDLFREAEETPTEEVQETVEEEDEENDENGKIFFMIPDVDATITSNKAVSYCTFTLVVENDLKKDLKKISGTLRIGTAEKKFNFSNLSRNGGLAGFEYMLIGASCEKVLDPPVINVTTCQVDGWSEKKCKEKVTYTSLTNENTL